MRLIPRDEMFFQMFTAIAQRLTTAARLLKELFADPSRANEYMTRIKEVEHEADNLTHEVIGRIDQTFVTPIDREDIHMLASRLDDVVDLIDGSARRAAIFRITEVKPAALKLTDVLIRAAEAIETAVAGIKDHALVLERARQVKQYEEEGDTIFHEAVGALFTGTADPMDVIKWKELFDRVEDAIDECDNVANVLESIVLKNR